MKRKLPLISCCSLLMAISLLGIVAAVNTAMAGRVTTRLKAPSRTTLESENRLRTYPEHKTDFEEVVENVTFIAYDKKASSDKETFFVDNGSDKSLDSIELEITYYTPDGRQIHKRTVFLNQSFPAKESRKVDIKSWDTQRSFHYINSVPSTKGSAPYTVRFKILSIKKS